jgi:hypothetical protein
MPTLHAVGTGWGDPLSFRDRSEVEVTLEDKQQHVSALFLHQALHCFMSSVMTSLDMTRWSRISKRSRAAAKWRSSGAG